jgi:ubiquinone/menaquinone biosynthesis C-methylase UbiE
MAELKVIDEGFPDSVTRLHRVQGDHPEVVFAPWTTRGASAALAQPQVAFYLPVSDRKTTQETVRSCDTLPACGAITPMAQGGPLINRVDYDKHQSAVYAQGRALNRQVMADWLAAFARHAQSARPLCVLDLGSGTGRFSPALAETFGGPVYGVEPSAGMRNEALELSAHPAVTYVEGAADAIPLPDASVDLVLLFLVWHHVPDQAAAAAEISRVLRPGGRVLLRSTFADRLPESSWRTYFPRATELERAIFPTVAEAEQQFTTAGLRRVGLDVVNVQVAEDYKAYAERLHLKAISIFEHLTEQEIETGFAQLDADTAAGRATFRLAEDGDLLIFESPGSISRPAGSNDLTSHRGWDNQVYIPAR